MPEIDLKQFLRKHDFKHRQDKDRGAIWSNGVIDLFVEKSYDKEPSKLRSIMDQIRTGHRKKVSMQAAEAARMARDAEKAANTPSIPPPQWRAQAPEEHREAQIAAALNEPDEEETPTPAPEKPVEKTDVDDKGKTRFRGDERKYVFGRMKAMFSAKMDNLAIAKAFQAEGIRLPSGKPISAGYIGTMRNNWKLSPKSAAKYAEILYPRKKAPGAPELAPPRPVVIAPPPPAPKRSRFGLPLSVDMVLADPEVDDDHRLQILMVFVDMPKCADAMLGEETLTVQQKIAVIEALGIRRVKPPKEEA